MSSERTEEPTPKKLKKARAEGQVPKSRELPSAFLLLTAAVGLGASGEAMQAHFAEALDVALRAAAQPASAAVAAAGLEIAAIGARACAPILGALVVAAVLGHVAQTGPMFATAAIGADLLRLDPVAGMGRIVSRKSAIELLRAIVKLALVALVAAFVLRDALPAVLASVSSPPASVLAGAGTLVRTLVLRVGGAILALSVLDVLYQRWQFAREQRMTKDEVKREHREADGDPHVKRERERVRREIAQHDLLESVRRADVVVVNPTHLAVALRFDEESEQSAPEIVGKGQDELARRIVAVAREAGVPVLEDVPLARGLYELEVGQEVPERLYEAAAAILRAAWAERDAGGAA